MLPVQPMQDRDLSTHSSVWKPSPRPVGDRNEAALRSLPPAAPNDAMDPDRLWVLTKKLAALFDLDEKWLNLRKRMPEHPDAAPPQP